MDPDDLGKLTNAYRAELEAMDSIALSGDKHAKAWNRHVDRMQRAQLGLRKTEEGRAAITKMVMDAVPTVARWSAAHALFWAEPEARAYLQNLAASGGVGAFNAKMVLREFDAGRLRIDWEPKS